MSPLLDNPAAAWEAFAVALAVAYLALAIRENIWCWAAGMASSAIYLVLLARAALYLESALQVFYVGVSVYGWRRWGGRPANRVLDKPDSLNNLKSLELNFAYVDQAEDISAEAWNTLWERIGRWSGVMRSGQLA